jgi:hypothetical protein
VTPRECEKGAAKRFISVPWQSHHYRALGPLRLACDNESELVMPIDDGDDAHEKHLRKRGPHEGIEPDPHA